VCYLIIYIINKPLYKKKKKYLLKTASLRNASDTVFSMSNYVPSSAPLVEALAISSVCRRWFSSGRSVGNWRANVGLWDDGMANVYSGPVFIWSWSEMSVITTRTQTKRCKFFSEDITDEEEHVRFDYLSFTTKNVDETMIF